MPFIAYQERRFSADVLETIERANEILNDYAEQGYDLTLRQLYYQFVARGFIPNEDRQYKRLGSIVNDARLAGLIDWDHITDRTRNLRQNSHWKTPVEIIDACAAQFQIDKWATQPRYVEVWVEKDALVGILQVACEPLDVAYFSCRGYTSQSEMWATGQRLLSHFRAGQEVHILHLGDHDPSGVDMSRDIEERLLLFMRHHIQEDLNENRVKDMPRHLEDETSDEYHARLRRFLTANRRYIFPVKVHRIALNMAQVRQYNPPPNPAKLTDSRCRAYIEEHGQQSWELDALEPAVLTALIQDSVRALRNEQRWQAQKAIEDRHRAQLHACASRWEEISETLKGGDDAKNE